MRRIHPPLRALRVLHGNLATFLRRDDQDSPATLISSKRRSKVERNRSDAMHLDRGLTCGVRYTSSGCSSPLMTSAGRVVDHRAPRSLAERARVCLSRVVLSLRFLRACSPRPHDEADAPAVARIDSRARRQAIGRSAAFARDSGADLACREWRRDRRRDGAGSRRSHLSTARSAGGCSGRAFT